MMLQDSLQKNFGFMHFLKKQKEVIEKVLANESAVAIFPTGAGKSLCYQMPALHLPGVTLVVSPLLSLMKDQIDFLASKRIPAVKLDSGMTPEDYLSAIQAARDGAAKILMISVERFKNERFRLQLGRMKVSLMVVDEAHCISEWGHNFRPDYLKIPTYRRQFNIPQVLLLTATATPKVADDMCSKFEIPKENVFCTGFYRENLQLQIVPAPAAAKNSTLIDILSRPPTGSSIVYVTQQKTAEIVAEMLCGKGLNAAAYHAGMKTEEREAIQNRFMDNRIDIVVATIAFGMGIDKRDIRKVVHYDLPKSIESYSQEIGRAGRDGKPSVCSLLGDRSGVPILENFAYGDTPEKKSLRSLLETVKRSTGKRLEIRSVGLSYETDIRMLPLKTALVYLEIRGIIEPKYSYFEEYPFKQIETASEIAAHFNGERKEFVKAIFENSKAAKIWSRPDIETIMAVTGAERRRIVAALDYFDEKGWIELQPKSAVDVFEVIDPDFDIDVNAAWLGDLFASRESYEIERIGQMIALFEESDCLAKGLSEHFGESLLQLCGVCSACRTGKKIRLPGDPPLLTGFNFESMTKALYEKLDVPFSAPLITRFLCGINTPRLMKLKAISMENFGCLANYRYQNVLGWVEKHLNATRSGID